MRIISGKYRAKRIHAPKNITARPTTDMAKESLFNLLNNYFYFDEITVLDLFSGTGNISYEFASRGCTSITLVEKDYNCYRFIKKTVADLKFEEEITVIKGDVSKYIQKTASSFDVVFADPPYDKYDLEELVNTLFSRGTLKKDGILIVEHSERSKLEHLPHFAQQRKYGSVNFSIFQQQDQGE